MKMPELTYEVTEVNGLSNDERLGELILYVADRCKDDLKFGATKLNKILQKVDFLYFAEHGEPLTGSAYMKIKHGPVPLRLVPIREKLIEENKIEIEARPYFGKFQHRVIPKQNQKAFTAEQLGFVDKVIAMLELDSATDVSVKSHNQAYDDAGSIGNLIPYESIFLADDQSLTYDDVLAANDFHKLKAAMHK